MRFCGVGEYFHDASIAFIEEDGLVSFASDSERYTKTKNEPFLHEELVDMIDPKDHITYYEDEKLRDTRTASLKKKPFTQPPHRFTYHTHIQHHESHAASAFYTRHWDSVEDTVMMTIDGYGEFQSATIMDHSFNLIADINYPKSIGSIYALVTIGLGFKALQEEYIVMGMSAFGEPNYIDVLDEMVELLVGTHDTGLSYDVARDMFLLTLKKRCPNQVDLAASIQLWAEREVLAWAKQARKHGSKLVYAGGVAQNVLINSKLKEIFDEVHIAINPGDGGGALGAAAYSWAKHTGKTKLNWSPYVGYDESSASIDPKEVARSLVHDDYMCGVINGKAEYGPRALGNRSLLANPTIDLKDTVNKVKNRQQFRPFAPAILEEYAAEYFEGPMNPYMQFTAKALHPHKSVTHIDGTARVQVVPSDCKSIIRPILEEFYELTKVPMLLNTSLNVKGKPICNDKHDARLFQETRHVKVWGI